jgi:soluble P-type ATPase
MIVEIPGRPPLKIDHLVLDFNGTIAVDGRLIPGVAERIEKLVGVVAVHVITADTYGSVEKQLENISCKVVTISRGNQDAGKLNYLETLGKEHAICVGNGRNDRLMLKASAIGIALIQQEGVCVEALLAADIACTSILDVFAYFDIPERIQATLRN